MLTSLALIAFFLTPSRPALADLQVFPTRLLLTDQTKTAYLSLRHLGTKPETYSVSAVFYRMHLDGRLEQISAPTPDERPILSFLRFSPRSVTLAPKSEQVVRVMTYNTHQLADGEYRAHIRFEPQTLDVKQDDSQAGGKVKMNLTAKIAVAIPIFVRRGSVTVGASIDSARIEKRTDGKIGYAVKLTNRGSGFLFGDIFVFEQDGDRSVEIGKALGVSSYVPSREIAFPLEVEPKSGPNQKIRFEFRSPVEDGGKILTQSEIPSSVPIN